MLDDELTKLNLNPEQTKAVKSLVIKYALAAIHDSKIRKEAENAAKIEKVENYNIRKS